MNPRGFDFHRPVHIARQLLEWCLFLSAANLGSAMFPGFGIPGIQVGAPIPTVTAPVPIAPYLISAAPAEVTCYEGQSLRVEITAIGTPSPTYQWRKDGEAIAGATTKEFSVPNVEPSHAGSYTVTASNQYGSVTSRPTVVTVVAPIVPSITSQPVSQKSTAGLAVRFEVSAAGAPAPTYQWRKDGRNLPGATTATLALTNLRPADVGNYDVVVSNFAGSVTSQPATLTLRAPLLITRQPASATVAPLGAVTFSAAASGDNLAYQWKKDGRAIAGATAATYALADVSTTDMGFYSVVVSSDERALESTPAILTVQGSLALSYPRSVAVDGAGNLFIADTARNRICRVSPTGAIAVVAGTMKTRGSADGTGPAAEFNQPIGLAVDYDGNLFVADTSNHTIRKIVVAGVVTTIAGLAGSPGAVDGTGSAARFNMPWGIGVDRTGNVFVAENGSATVRKISPSGKVSTLAGQAGQRGHLDAAGGLARFAYPTGLAVDEAGNVYVGDNGNHVIRRINPAGVVSTVWSPSAFHLLSPLGVAVDRTGNVFVSDANSHLVCRISADGIFTRLAGMFGSRGSIDGQGDIARFFSPEGLAVDRTGRVFVADSGNGAIRAVAPDGTVTTLRFDGANFTPSRLANLSARGYVPAGGALTPGLSWRGSGPKLLLVRAVGPTLARFGVSEPLANPRLDLFPAGATTVLFSNDDWSFPAPSRELLELTATTGAFALEAGAKDSALPATLGPTAPRNYTARVTSVDPSAAGIVLAEIYDADVAPNLGRLVAVSTLASTGAGDRALLPGFTVVGPLPKRLLLRAIGPSLAQFGVDDFLADPRLALYAASLESPVAANDDWSGEPMAATAASAAGAFALAQGSKDAALVLTLPPGGYTVAVNGAGDTSGQILVEIYDLDP